MMLVAPVLASVCAFSSLVNAAPVVSPSPEERGLLNLGSIFSGGKVVQLDTIVAGVSVSTKPVLQNIQSLVASPTLVQTLVNDYIGYSGSSLISINLDSALVDGLMSSDVANGLYPTTRLQNMAISLNGIVSGAEIQAIVQALSGLNGVTPALYNLIEQILTSISQMGTAKSAVDKLASATGANGVLAALNLGKATNIVSNFDSLTSQLFLTLNALNTNVATVLADSSADVTTLNTAIQSLQAPLDSTLASTIKGSNVILSGVTSLLKASLVLKSALKNLTTLKGVMSTVSGLVNSLGLSNLKSVLGF